MTDIVGSGFNPSTWVESFKKAAKLYHLAREWENEDVEMVAYEQMRLLIEELDKTGPDARRILMPLLKEADMEIRVVAAAYMVKYKPELGVAVLHEVHESAELEARLTALHLLTSYEMGDLDI